MKITNTVKNEFIILCKNALTNNSFHKITISKATSQVESGLKNIYLTTFIQQNIPKLKVVYRYETRDITKTILQDELEELIDLLLPNSFLHAILFEDNSQVDLRFSKKRIPVLSKTNTKNIIEKNTEHNENKHYLIDSKKALYLQDLGITDTNGNVKPTAQAKYKQLNKFIEIVNNVIKQKEFKHEISICDMGSGKGYLTFGLYDYLKNILGISCKIIGVETRNDLVDLCNSIAKKYKFDGLQFEQNTIENFKQKNIDILIALHACDTATDDALFYGLKAKSQIIITAPCCHKQIRNEMRKHKNEDPILQHGIFEERQAEMITDTIRGLILESKNYHTKIFEFISPEHTSKNTIITAVKNDNKIDQKNNLNRIKLLKEKFGIEKHYLEELIKKE